MIECDPKAPKGMFRVVWYDSYEHIGGLMQDFPTVREAIQLADSNASAASTYEMIVNDDGGRKIYHATDRFRGTTDPRVCQLKSLVDKGLLTPEEFVKLV